jgi:hypothetical protein
MPINRTRKQLAAVASTAGTDADGPLVMLNMDRYRRRAAYADEPPGGDLPDVSGREAYERYGAKALEVLTRLGGEILWHLQTAMTVIGSATTATSTTR